jgi:hypothetical protein
VGGKAVATVSEVMAALKAHPRPVPVMLKRCRRKKVAAAAAPGGAAGGAAAAAGGGVPGTGGAAAARARRRPGAAGGAAAEAAAGGGMDKKYLDFLYGHAGKNDVSNLYRTQMEKTDL